MSGQSPESKLPLAPVEFEVVPPLEDPPVAVAVDHLGKGWQGQGFLRLLKVVPGFDVKPELIAPIQALDSHEPYRVHISHVANDKPVDDSDKMASVFEVLVAGGNSKVAASAVIEKVIDDLKAVSNPDDVEAYAKARFPTLEKDND
jgi:hypothetical protein